jgi:hypothetical protein
MDNKQVYILTGVIATSIVIALVYYDISSMFDTDKDEKES